MVESTYVEIPSISLAHKSARLEPVNLVSKKAYSASVLRLEVSCIPDCAKKDGELGMVMVPIFALDAVKLGLVCDMANDPVVARVLLQGIFNEVTGVIRPGLNIIQAVRV